MRRKTTEFIGNNIKYFIIAPLLTIAESSTELLLPFLMGRIVDDGLNAENSRNVLYIGLWMIGISLLGFYWAFSAPEHRPKLHRDTDLICAKRCSARFRHFLLRI